MQTALVLAPYSPAGSPIAALGAARKIRGVLAALQGCFDQVVVVNSAHNDEERLPAAWDNLKTEQGGIAAYLPPRWPSRPIGKMLNLVGVRRDVEAVLGRFPKPGLVWIYNSYAYEALFLWEILKRWPQDQRPRVILEVEDWPLARLRKGHPKPWLDWMGMKFALKQADAVMCVNDALAQKIRMMAGRQQEVRVLPGLVDEKVLKLHTTHPPFRVNGKLQIGYFGGLSEEKGVGMVLEAIRASREEDWEWIVSGSGPLAEKFRECAATCPKLKFHGTVEDDRLVRLMGKCDVILNPHQDISQMGEGVFPFKVIESVATGRLVISTKLPPSGLFTLDEALEIFDGSVEGLVEALSNSREIFKGKIQAIRAAVQEIRNTVSVSALESWIVSHRPSVVEA